jgi:hypothetical protein
VVTAPSRSRAFPVTQLVFAAVICVGVVVAGVRYRASRVVLDDVIVVADPPPPTPPPPPPPASGLSPATASARKEKGVAFLARARRCGIALPTEAQEQLPFAELLKRRYGPTSIDPGCSRGALGKLSSCRFFSGNNRRELIYFVDEDVVGYGLFRDEGKSLNERVIGGPETTPGVAVDWIRNAYNSYPGWDHKLKRFECEGLVIWIGIDCQPGRCWVAMIEVLEARFDSR